MRKRCVNVVIAYKQNPIRCTLSEKIIAAYQFCKIYEYRAIAKARNGDRAPAYKQQEVIDFIEFLEFKKNTATEQKAQSKSKLPLGKRLRQIRQEIVA